MKRLRLRLAELTLVAFAIAPMASAADLYVATNGTGDGSDWAHATNSIQGAIDAIDGSYTTNTVWVSNGVYATGGVTNFPSGTALTNRIAIYKAITVRSANNDPTNTIIQGAWDPVTTNGQAAVRCVYITNNASLIGFTLTNGATLNTGYNNDSYGAGAYGGTLSNCVLVRNIGGYCGGGAYASTLYNCTLISNKAAGGGGVYSCILSNCTLTGNVGGGAWGGTLYNCTLTGNTGLEGGGANGSTLYDCTLTGNTADMGGGARDSVLYHCTLTSNCIRMGSSGDGGGVSRSTLTNCTLIGNWAQGSGASGGGGGAAGSVLYNCAIVSNTSAGSSGGVSGGTLSNCTLIGNSATLYYGGGAYGGTLYNCLIIGNQSGREGGGTRGCVLYNCTVVGNKAGGGSYPAGGVYQGEIYNTIVYSNTAGGTRKDTDGMTVTNYSCASDITPGGGNITNAPQFVNAGSGYGTNHVAGNYRLNNGSPCINAGTNQAWMNGAVDLDTRHRRDRFSGIVDMGCYVATGKACEWRKRK
jgi:hypothetical protein